MVRINFNRLRFLVIDDNAHMRRIMRSLLHGFGTREVYEAPRPFVRTKTYFGPDRRRNVNANYIGPERRKGGKADVIRQQPLLDKVLG